MDWESGISCQRDRTLSEDGKYENFSQNWTASPPLDPYAYTSTVQIRTQFAQRRIWDTVTPEWKRKVEEGQILKNGLLDFTFKGSFKPVRFTAKCDHIPTTAYVNYIDTVHGYGVGDAQTVFGAFPGNFQEVLAKVITDSGSLRAEAVTLAFSRVDVSELEMLASLGEMPETVAWFRDVLLRLIKIMQAIKKKQLSIVLNQAKLPTRKRRRPNPVTGMAANAWMEWRYAIMPLVYEVKAYLASLESKIETKMRKTARSKNFSSTETPSSHENVESWYKIHTDQVETTERSIRAGVLYSLDPELTGWWTHLGLDAPISAFWAITTLSFVWDWFFNIGTWIASWEPRLGLTPLTNWVVETRTVSVHGRAYFIHLGMPNWIFSEIVPTDGEYSGEYKVKARWIEPERQIFPTFRMKNLNVAQIVDLTILGQQIARQLLR